MEVESRALRRPARVLLVIDQPLLAEVTKLALNHGHFTTRVAPSAEEALVALRTWQPQLAVVDMDLSLIHI